MPFLNGFPGRQVSSSHAVEDLSGWDQGLGCPVAVSAQFNEVGLQCENQVCNVKQPSMMFKLWTAK